MSHQIKLLNVGFPKAGNTWMGMTLSYALNAEFIEYNDGKKVTVSTVDDVVWRLSGNIKDRKKTNVTYVEKTHLFPYEWKNHDQFDELKLLYIERDPRDIAVSYFYYQYFHRPFKKTGKVKDCSKSERHLFFFKTMLSYFKHKIAWQPFVACYISYEKSWEGTYASITDRLDNLQIEFDDSHLKEAIEYFSWENHSKGRKPGETDNTRFIRSGLPGSYKKEFDTVDHLLYFSAYFLSLLITLKRKITGSRKIDMESEIAQYTVM